MYWLIDGLLAGRPGPVERPWDLAALRAGGVEALVSLNSEPDTAEIAAAGLRHYSLPQLPSLPLVGPLKKLLLRGVERALDAIHAEVSAGHAVVVHCHAGKDRTGLVLAAYLIRYEGLAAGEAIARVRAVKPNAMSALGYEAMVWRFARQERKRMSARNGA